MPKTKKPTKQDLHIEEMLSHVKGRESKAAVRAFADAVCDLIDRIGWSDAITIHMKAGGLYTLARKAAGDPPKPATPAPQH